jgi:hypothetical protein
MKTKVKFVPVRKIIKAAPLKEDVLREWKYSSTILDFGTGWK